MLGVRELIPKIQERLESPDENVRESAIDTLASMSSTDSIPLLRRRLEDSNSDVRESAAVALCQLGSGDGIALLLELGSDLFPLNALRSAEIFGRLFRIDLPDYEGPRAGLLDPIARAAGIPVTPPLSDSAPWLAERVVERSPSVGRALREFTNHSYDVVIDADRIRILPRAEAWKFWTEWAAAREKK